jgi:hypothetical protein
MAKSLRHLIILGAAFTVRCLAQNNPVPDVLSVDFTVYAFNDEPAQLRYAVGKSVSPELHFFPTARSEHYHYEGPAHLVFFRQTTVPSSNGQPPVVQRQPVAEVQLNPDIKKPLFVFFPLKQPAASGLEFSVFGFDDSLANLPAGHLAIFNATEYQLALTIGKKAITLNPGPSDAFETGHTVKVAGALVIGGVRYPGAIEDIFPGGPNERGLLFLYPPLRRGSPVLQYAHLVESVGKPTAEPKKR